MGSLVVTTKLTAKKFVFISAKLFYILFTQKLYRFYFSKNCYHESIQNPKLSCTHIFVYQIYRY
jgi:hypothetical protein